MDHASMSFLRRHFAAVLKETAEKALPVHDPYAMCLQMEYLPKKADPPVSLHI